jgi:flagellar basal body-associated protein FliL
VANEKAQEQSAEQGDRSSKKKTLAMGGVLVGVMAVEAVVVFMLVKHFAGSPAAAEAATPLHAIESQMAEQKPQDVELNVVNLRAQNERSQRQITYDLDVFISVSDANKDRVNEVLQRRKATVQDRLSRVVRAAQPEEFTEPDLRTLRKQFQVELDQIMGQDGLIREVLIPSIVANEN